MAGACVVDTRGKVWSLASALGRARGGPLVYRAAVKVEVVLHEGAERYGGEMVDVDEGGLKQVQGEPGDLPLARARPLSGHILAVEDYLRKKETTLTPTTMICKSPSAN